MNEKELAELRKRREPEIELLRRMAEAVKASKEVDEKKKVSGSLAMVGDEYLPERALMVVGQAPDGAMADKWFPSKLGEGFIDNVVQTFSDPSPNGHPCPMRWVTDTWDKERAQHVWDRKGLTTNPYSTNRSPFWQTLKGVLAKLNLADTDDDSWPSYVVWTNLYKISPADGGNPPTPLCGAQFKYCAELLKMEIESYKPVRVLFSTGLAWAKPFLEKLGFVPDQARHGHELGLVKDIGTLGDAAYPAPQVVVARHPAKGPKRDDWVRQVAEAFSAPQ
ncbi:MAG: hypothetical protein ACYDC3_04400 [Candidatus Binataceae bacterium]